MKKAIVLMALAGCVLSACDVAPPLEFNPGVAAVSFTGSAPNHRIRDETTTIGVRAFQMAQTADGKPKRVEVSGATCTLKSDHLTATVVTPQQVALPKYDQDPALANRGVPPSILVECRKDGMSGRELLAANPGALHTGGSGNLLVDVIAFGITASAAATMDWRYALGVAVTMQ